MSTAVTIGSLLVGTASTLGWALSARGSRQRDRRLCTDELTGLPNRLGMIRRFDRTTRRQRGGAVGLLLLDLDGFKQVNDSYGHAAGNALLQHVAAQILRTVEDCDALPVRLHGDEFVVLLTALPVDGGLEQAGRLATRVSDAIRTPMPWEGEQITLGASVGATVTSIEHADLRLLLHVADQRMYAAKLAADGRRGQHGSAAARPSDVAGPATRHHETTVTLRRSTTDRRRTRGRR